jgi:2-polyprenyl-6-methoxyphenol hydroxylase-like FAD-dependent oxidoreductase
MGFRVVIVGGSISGLTLANVLEKFDIDYVLLEGHTQIAPQLGASIGLLPSGLRILDQIGCYDRIRAEAGDTYYRARMRLYNGTTWHDKGSTSFSEQLEKRSASLAPSNTESVLNAAIYCNRIGYPQIFIDRQRLVQILYDNLKCRDCVLTNRRVSHVEMDAQKAVAYTTDGSNHAGDIIVGADGVHSATRGEMWRNATEDGSKLFNTNAELGSWETIPTCIVVLTSL